MASTGLRTKGTFIVCRGTLGACCTRKILEQLHVQKWRKHFNFQFSKRKYTSRWISTLPSPDETVSGKAQRFSVIYVVPEIFSSLPCPQCATGEAQTAALVMAAMEEWIHAIRRTPVFFHCICTLCAPGTVQCSGRRRERARERERERESERNTHKKK